MQEGMQDVKAGVSTVQAGITTVQDSVAYMRAEVTDMAQDAFLKGTTLVLSCCTCFVTNKLFCVERLRYVTKDAYYDSISRPSCFDGTRVDVLSHIHRWVGRLSQLEIGLESLGADVGASSLLIAPPRPFFWLVMCRPGFKPSGRPSRAPSGRAKPSRCGVEHRA